MTESTPDPVAALDQAKRAFKDFAEATYACYRYNIEAGFTTDQAFALAQTWFAETVRSGLGQ